MCAWSSIQFHPVVGFVAEPSYNGDKTPDVQAIYLDAGHVYVGDQHDIEDASEFGIVGTWPNTAEEALLLDIARARCLYALRRQQLRERVRA